MSVGGIKGSKVPLSSICMGILFTLAAHLPPSSRQHQQRLVFPARFPKQSRVVVYSNGYAWVGL